jgi:hypothetical protein
MIRKKVRLDTVAVIGHPSHDYLQPNPVSWLRHTHNVAFGRYKD